MWTSGGGTQPDGDGARDTSEVSGKIETVEKVTHHWAKQRFDDSASLPLELLVRQLLVAEMTT